MSKSFKKRREVEKRKEKQEKQDENEGEIKEFDKLRQQKMRNNVIGDKKYDIFLHHFMMDKVLSTRQNIPITNKFTIENYPRKVVRLWWGYLTSNFNALPHPGMTIEEMMEDKF